MASKYKEIVKYLRDNYINNASSPKKLPSEPQLSKMLGVSRFPVNRAISNLIECGEVTRLPGVGTFIKGFEPESYRQKKQQKGIIVVSFTGTVNAEIFHGIQEIVLSQKVQLANLFEKGKSNKVNYKPETLKSVVNTDEFGLLVIPPLEFEDDKHNSFKALLEEAEHNNYPMVIMERPCVEFDGPQVVIDNAGGTAMAVETMLKNGFEKVAYIGKDDYLVGKERAKGYFRAYRENGLDINQDLIAIDRNGENFMNQIGQFTAKQHGPHS